jgi:hypothetical protein
MEEPHPMFPTLVEMRTALQVRKSIMQPTTRGVQSVLLSLSRQCAYRSSTTGCILSSVVLTGVLRALRLNCAQRVVEVLVAEGDSHLHYLSGLELFSEDDAGTIDNCLPAC